MKSLKFQVERLGFGDQVIFIKTSEDLQDL